MNRLVLRISAVGLGLAIALSSPSAFAAKKPKKKKNVDLSANPLANVSSKQPDKELFDKAMVAMKHGKYDVARLDLQTLLNTYGDSEYSMRAKLAVGDTWFKEGGTAALTQAESEYKDFITFFPNTPEAAEAQMKVGDIYFQQMEKPDRDPQNAVHAEQEYRTMLEQFPDSPLTVRNRRVLRLSRTVGRLRCPSPDRRRQLPPLQPQRSGPHHHRRCLRAGSAGHVARQNSRQGQG